MPRALLRWSWIILTGAASSAATSTNEQRSHFWPHNRGKVGQYGYSPVKGPFKLKESLNWTWPPWTEASGFITAGPVIDDEKNLYISRDDGIYKLGENGVVRWTYKPPIGIAVNCPSLMGDSLYGSTTHGYFFSVDLETGKQLWGVRHAPSVGSDTGYVDAHSGVVVGAANLFEMIVVDGGAGSTAVVGLNSTDGSKIWQFTPDSVVWNFMASFPDDGTLVFQDKTGQVYRLWLGNGTLIWKTGMRHDPTKWTDGGTIYGNNGVVYSVYVSGHIGTFDPQYPGRLNAYRLSDGRLLWYQVLPAPPNAFPAVGRLGLGPELSVVIPVGMQATYPGYFRMPQWLPEWIRLGAHWLSIVLAGDTTSTGYYSRRFWEVMYFLGFADSKPETLQHYVFAFDAQTGQSKWSFKLPPWERFACAGDEDYFLFRPSSGRRWGLPNPFTDPTIGGDGTVYVGSSHGNFYALRDTNGDGIVTGEEEVSSIDILDSAQNPGPGLAPGMLAVVNHCCVNVFTF